MATPRIQRLGWGQVGTYVEGRRDRASAVVTAGLGWGSPSASDEDDDPSEVSLSVS
jgi:hypothetical protein